METRLVLNLNKVHSTCDNSALHPWSCLQVPTTVLLTLRPGRQEVRTRVWYFHCNNSYRVTTNYGNMFKDPIKPLTLWPCRCLVLSGAWRWYEKILWVCVLWERFKHELHDILPAWDDIQTVLFSAEFAFDAWMSNTHVEGSIIAMEVEHRPITNSCPTDSFYHQEFWKAVVQGGAAQKQITPTCTSLTWASPSWQWGETIGVHLSGSEQILAFIMVAGVWVSGDQQDHAVEHEGCADLFASGSASGKELIVAILTSVLSSPMS